MIRDPSTGGKGFLGLEVETEGSGLRVSSLKGRGQASGLGLYCRSEGSGWLNIPEKEILAIPKSAANCGLWMDESLRHLKNLIP